MLHHRPLRPHRLTVAIGLAALSLTLPPLSVLGFAAGKPAIQWATETTGAAASERAAANPICSAIERTINRHIATMKSLRRDIDKASRAPPSTVYGAIQGMLGNAPPNAKVVEQTRKLANERKAADGLNVMLQTSQCAAVDIDAALARGTSSAQTAPEAPKAAPDLLPLPQEATAP